jgi:hypothetical protein
MNEIWKDIIGYEGFYQVSNLGRVKSCERYVKHFKGGNRLLKSKPIKISSDSYGYKIVCLCKNGLEKTLKVHRLVAIAFIDSVENKLQINHIDGIKSNNCVENLEWVNNSENMKHAHLIGLKKTMINNEKAVLVFNKLSNEFIQEYVSIANAARNLNIRRTDISGVLNNRQKSANGYCFKYKN